MMRPEFTAYLAQQRIEQRLQEARAARLTAEARRRRRPPVGAQPRASVTIRLDRVSDASRLYQLAALSGKRLAPGPFVVAEVDGRVLAASPLAGGATVADPREGTAELRPLLALRVAQLAERDGLTGGWTRRFRGLQDAARVA